MSDWKDADVLCPFYMRNSETSISCEGVEKGNRIHLAFRTEGKKNEYMGKHCCENYAACRLYKMLMDKYGEA